jgi:hypothetical protein
MKLRWFFPNQLNRSTPLDPKLIFWGRLGTFRYCMKVDAKLAELAPLTHKFAKQTLVLIFRNERIQSTPLDPKLLFWGISDRSLLHESRCKTGRTGAINAQLR